MDHRYENRREQNNTRKHNARFSIGPLMIGLCVMALAALTWEFFISSEIASANDVPAAQSPTSSPPAITVEAASGARTTIENQGNKGSTITSNEIPHLVLFRNAALTAAAERTLLITLENLPVRPVGITATLKLETQHGDPDQGGSERRRITAWQESRRIDFSQQDAQIGAQAVFVVEFSESSASNLGNIPTPTDYYVLQVIIQDVSTARPVTTIRIEHAFLMENQWVAPLMGAGSHGPQELIVYYCDMFPFQRDAGSRLPRTVVAEFVQNELLSQMVEAVRLQTDGWGFNWDGWVSYSSAGITGHLPVALSDGETWFHGPVPDRGNSNIAVNVNGGNNVEYETLTDGVMSTFHHELFHNFQRAIAFASGGSGDVDGKDAAWQFFSEGMASFVPTVAQRQVQFSQSRQARAYIAKAVQFVGGRGFAGEMNTSYTDLNPYHSAMYWRFLYEQCGGMTGGGENPGAGMGVIRRTLQVLYSKSVVDIDSSTDLVGNLPGIMDRALSSPEAASCPFSSYADSLANFARSIHALRLVGGRCTMAGAPSRCGFYDPSSLYSEPVVKEVSYSGGKLLLSQAEQPYPAGIKSSYGMDFIELKLRPEVNGQPLTIEVLPRSQSRVEYKVQIVRMYRTGNGGIASQKAAQVMPAETLAENLPGAPLSYHIPALDLDTYNQIGVIITRVDAGENLDPVGAYTLVVKQG